MALPNPVAFQVFGHNIYWYGILIAVAVLSAILLCMRRAPLYGMTADTIVDLAIFIIPSALIGARLYYVIFTWSEFASNPIRILYVWEGGLAFYGGLIGAFIAAVVCVRVKKVSLVKLLDLTAPAVALGQAIGRWGNFVNQEAYGVAVTNPAFQFFPLSVWIQAEGGWHMATFFYESLACLLISLFLLWYAKRKPMPRVGNIALFYGLLYGLERAIVEGFRTDSLYIGSLRVSQVVSILLVVACGAMLLIRLKQKREEIVEIDPNLVMRRRADPDDAPPEEDDDGAAAQEPEATTDEGAEPQPKVMGNEEKEGDTI